MNVYSKGTGTIGHKTHNKDKQNKKHRKQND